MTTPRSIPILKDLLPWLLMTALTVSWMLDRNGYAPEARPAALAAQAVQEAETPPGQVFQRADLAAQLEASGRAYLPFLNEPTLRAGLYALPADDVDGQQPHDKDEVYYVMQGRSGMTIDGEAYTVEPGSVIFVAARAEHRFHDIEEDLQLLVFFSEAEPKPADAH